MAKSTKHKSPIRELVKEAVADLNGEPLDPQYDPEQELRGPERLAEKQKYKDEAVIDELLSDIYNKEGYYLKLKKYLGNNEWELKQVIENEWRNWADIETEINRIVRENTRKNPRKWGSGQYRVEINCKGGYRGKPYPPKECHIDAGEDPALIDGMYPTTANGDALGFGQLESFKNMLDFTKSVIPQQPDPGKMHELITNAYMKGAENKNNESNMSQQMMMTMMAAMMGAFKDLALALKQPTNVNPPTHPPEDSLAKMLDVMSKFGVLNNVNGNGNKQDTLSTLKELKALGVDLFHREDPAEQIQKFKQIADLAVSLSGLSGAGEKPSITERLVDALAPHVPKIISDIKSVADNATEVQRLMVQNQQQPKMVTQPQTQPQAQAPMEEKTTYQQMQGKPSVSPNEEEMIRQQLEVFFNQLYDAAKSNNKMFYPIIYTGMMQDAQGQQMIAGIMQNKVNAGHMIQMLSANGGARFQDHGFIRDYLVGYTNGFVMWVKNLAQRPMDNHSTENKENTFDVKCNLCSEIFGYPTEQDFLEEPDKTCGTEKPDGGKCHGLLEPTAYGKA